MRKRGSMTVFGATLGLLAAFGLASTAGFAQTPAAAQAQKPFELSSPKFPSGGTLPRTQLNRRCGGRDISPTLKWRNPPMGTQSYVLLLHDPDAPNAQGFWHWVVYDIPGTVTSLPAGAGGAHGKLLPAGAIQARSDFGTVGYGGPCPPPGRAHRYYFRLYALPVARINVPPHATATIIAAYVDATALGRAQLMVTYGR
ncbi:MAG: YbhB/YbcL family Raf kinase inhibitor-like protein [Steroidobacteraceae bacterium]